MKTPPSQPRFIICETLSVDSNGRANLLGVFVGDDAILKGESPGKALPRLAMLAIFNDGEGECSLRISVLDPDGEPINPLKSDGKAGFRKGENTLVNIEWAGFPVPKWGYYTFEVKLDDNPYRHRFYISNVPRSQS